MSNTARLLICFIGIIISNVLLFLAGMSIFFNDFIRNILKKLIGDNSSQYVFVSLTVPIIGILIFDAVAIYVISKYILKEE